ncbi:uncharacterized protein MONOS_18138 [Monocercomonoides exilis]|uniref:uncharacterized protein n=1 Tax=Monocercomonoides exilis TaxID=2049356 RepID=UPI003559E8A7|nr:hypothetical protein MONOS_18138 [Monocercomonoides exilis]
MGLFPLNVYLDSYPDAAHVGKGKDGVGGYDSWFCGFDYYPCATITHAAQARYPDTNKKIELDSGYELAEVVGMTDGHEWEISCFCILSALSCASSSSLITSNSTLLGLTDCSIIHSFENSIGYIFVIVIGRKVKVERLSIKETLTFGEHSPTEFFECVDVVYLKGCNIASIEKRSGDGGGLNGVVGVERDEGKNGIIVIESCVMKWCRCVSGRGGGMCVGVKGEGSVVVNCSSLIDGCEAKCSKDSSSGSERRGRGMMIVMEWRDRTMKIESGSVSLLVFGENKASSSYGIVVMNHNLTVFDDEDYLD